MAAAKPMRMLTSLLLCVCVISSIQSSAESSPPATAAIYHRQSRPVFLDDIRSQCPSLVHLNQILEVNGEFLETLLEANKNQSVYTAVLFYASWCPFSRSFYSLFEVLSFMYPQIEHVAVEVSSATPSLLSRFGVHSVPAIFITNQSPRVRFRSSRDLISLVKFYKKITGYEPVHYIDMDRTGELSMEPNMWFTYLAFAITCLFIRAVLYPGAFGGARLLDVKRVWSNIRLSENSNFHFGFPR